MSSKNVKELLEKVGGKITLLPDPPPQEEEEECPRCGGLGFFVPDVDREHPAFGRAQACYCAHEALQARRWSASGLLEAEREWRLDYLAEMAGKASAVTAARALLQNQAGWLSVYGHYGVGKSGLLKAATAEAINAGYTAYYRRAEDVLAEARATFSDKDDNSALEVQARYASVPFLALDEIDRVSMTDWAQSFLFTLLDVRYNRRQEAATFLATNSRVGEMGSEWGYLESRMGDGLIMVMAGRSLRDT